MIEYIFLCFQFSKSDRLMNLSIMFVLCCYVYLFSIYLLKLKSHFHTFCLSIACLKHDASFIEIFSRVCLCFMELQDNFPKLVSYYSITCCFLCGIIDCIQTYEHYFVVQDLYHFQCRKLCIFFNF